MNKVFLAFCLTLVASVFTFAQSSDYKKAEFYAGYSNEQVDLGTNNNNNNNGNSVQNFFNNRLSFNGFEVAGVANISRYFGIKGDISGAYRNKGFNTTLTDGTNLSFNTRNSLYNFLAGVQVKDNTSTARFKPFAHALVGAGHARTKVENASCTNTGITTCSSLANSFSDTGLAGAIGGGVDVKLTDRVDLRAIQVDYNPIRLSGQTENNVRFGIGLVFK